MSLSLSSTDLVRSVPRIPLESREPGLLYSLLQSFAGMLVPLLLLRPFRRILIPRRSNSWGFLQFGVLFGFSSLWLLVLIATAATYAIKGFPPFEHPPKFDPLTPTVVFSAVFRALLGVLLVQAQIALLFDWLFFCDLSSALNAGIFVISAHGHRSVNQAGSLHSRTLPSGFLRSTRRVALYASSRSNSASKPNSTATFFRRFRGAWKKSK